MDTIDEPASHPNNPNGADEIAPLSNDGPDATDAAAADTQTPKQPAEYSATDVGHQLPIGDDVEVTKLAASAVVDDRNAVSALIKDEASTSSADATANDETIATVITEELDAISARIENSDAAVVADLDTFVAEKPSAAEIEHDDTDGAIEDAVQTPHHTAEVPVEIAKPDAEEFADVAPIITGADGSGEAEIEDGTAEVVPHPDDDDHETDAHPIVSAITCLDVNPDADDDESGEPIERIAEFNPLDVSDEIEPGHEDVDDAEDALGDDALLETPHLDEGHEDDEEPADDDDDVDIYRHDAGDFDTEAGDGEHEPDDDNNDDAEHDFDHFADEIDDDMNAECPDYHVDNDDPADGMDGEDDDEIDDDDDDDDDNNAMVIIPDRPQTVRTGTKRRRILALASGNEDSSDGADGRQTADDDAADGDADAADRLRSSSAASSEGGARFGSPATLLADCLLDERFEEIVRNEKPGPKSKKASTQLLKELQARALLQSAIVIPAAGDAAKRRKVRVLESESDDDAERAALPVTTSVDDIGVLTADAHDAPDDDADDDQLCAQIIIAEPMVVVEVDDDDDAIDTKPPGAAAIYPRDYPDSDEPILKKKVKVHKRSKHGHKHKNGDGGRPNNGNYGRSGPSTSSAARKQEQHHHHQHQRTKSAAPPARVSLYTSSEEEEYIPNDVYFGTPDRFDVAAVARKPRGSGRGRGSSSSRYEEEHRKYHHDKEKTASASSGRGRGRGRGRGSGGSKSKSYRQKYESDSCSSEASSSSEAERRRRKHAHKQQKRSSAYYPEAQRHHHTQNHHHQQQRHSAGDSAKPKRKDQSARFKDKARKIPNDVYFDSKVPLHVLYAYGSETSEDELPPFPPLNAVPGRPAAMNRPLPHKSHGHSRGGGGSSGRGSSHSSGRGSGRGGHHKSSSSTHSGHRGGESSRSATATHSKRGRKPTYATSNADLRLKHMRKCFRAAGFRKMRLKELWTDSDSTMDRADKILKLLRENGLVDDPTIDNCRLLRKVVVTNEEVRELDPSLILQTEGRTRRSAALAASAQIEQIVAERSAAESGGIAGIAATAEAPTTAAAAAASGTAAAAGDGDDGATLTVAQDALTKIKKIIDSDSNDE